jgi:hypothetical protein
VRVVRLLASYRLTDQAAEFFFKARESSHQDPFICLNAAMGRSVH